MIKIGMMQKVIVAKFEGTEQQESNRLWGEWDWSDPYDPMVTEGTLYGETTNYVFTGTYIGESF